MSIFDNLNSNLENWCNKNGIKDINVKAGIDFFYNPTMKSVTYAIMTTSEMEKTDTDFLQFFYEYGEVDGIGCSVLSFLHEVGHFMTLHLFSKSEKDTAKAYKTTIVPSIKDRHERNYAYWLNPIEFAANVWVIEFIKNYYDAVIELGNIFQLELNSLYDNYYEELVEFIDELNNFNEEF